MKAADLSLLDRVRWAADRVGETVIVAPGSGAARQQAWRLRVAGAQGVVFDAAASAALAKIGSLPAVALERMARSARLPWPSVLIEINLTAFRESIYEPSEDGAPDHMALLIQRVGDDPARVVCHMVGNVAHGGRLRPLVEPLAFLIDVTAAPVRSARLMEPVREACKKHLSDGAGVMLDGLRRKGLADGWSRESLAEALRHGRDVADLWVLGRDFIAGKVDHERKLVSVGGFDADDLAARTRLAACAAPVATDCADAFGLEAEAVRGVERNGMEVPAAQLVGEMAVEPVGSPRVALAAMIALGTHGVATVAETRPRGARLIGGRRAPYLAMSRVVIDLAAPLIVAARSPQCGSGDGRASPRRHSVRGFWRHFFASPKAARDCAHDWRPRPAGDGESFDRDRQECSACGSRRTWIREHPRGDAGRGFVAHEVVEVTA